ncbi:hypothetical protein EVAR_25338_1 [Eumeta japonica]|uniref:Uncharacterized protein n=1 Tax=Eumeta variegata TaxID=151549 RepID=A0A4C1XZF0_EUMVA|nr:hypothetical protein EVAR_25338_1 [Eumeta japonica]
MIYLVCSGVQRKGETTSMRGEQIVCSLLADKLMSISGRQDNNELAKRLRIESRACPLFCGRRFVFGLLDRSEPPFDRPESFTKLYEKLNWQRTSGKRSKACAAAGGRGSRSSTRYCAVGFNLARRTSVGPTRAGLTSSVSHDPGVGNLRLASHMRLFGCEAAAL